MNAAPLLNSVVAALAKVRLEAILIGNAAAAIHGAPVTTVDFDFMFRATPPSLAKLKKFARRLDSMIMRPYYPAAELYRVVNDDRGLQPDFMPVIHGVKSFKSLRSRAQESRIWRASCVGGASGGHHRQQTGGRAGARQSGAGRLGGNVV